MTGFELWTSVVGRGRSTNCATTTDLSILYVWMCWLKCRQTDMLFWTNSSSVTWFVNFSSLWQNFEVYGNFWVITYNLAKFLTFFGKKLWYWANFIAVNGQILKKHLAMSPHNSVNWSYSESEIIPKFYIFKNQTNLKSVFLVFKNGPTPASFSFIFGLFKQT